MPDGHAVQKMFAGIAGSYDRANHLLSGGIDFYWRRRLIQAVRSTDPRHIVDLATGSGDVAFALARSLPEIPILAMDFCEPMLEEARAKKSRLQPPPSIHFSFGDCLSLPCTDASTDAVTIAFGVRNLENREQGYREMLRILKPGGSLFVLEFTQPFQWFRPVYYLYLKVFLPGMARLVTGNRSAYQYLAGSIESFPTRESISRELLRAGFQEVSATPLTASIVAIHKALKAIESSNA